MNLNDLDQLVENYLKFRKFEKSAEVLAAERQEAQNNVELDDKDDVIDRIMKSLEKCDSLRLLTLWDTYIIQSLDQHPPESVAEARIAEFYVHLYCATYPFRSEVLETANSPDIAARYAARSMTIFKHFLEQRGRKLLKMPDFAGVKNLHKIAFPPTHPSYSYLFRPEWVKTTKDRIRSFLTEYFRPPRLYIDMMAVQNVSVMEAREVEIKRMFQNREDKILQFSRSIYDISHDLIETLDEGKAVDKEFLHNFKLKFDEFRAVLDPTGGGPGSSELAQEKVGGGGVVRRKRRKKKNRDHKGNDAPLITELSYTVIIQDIQSMVGEVEEELTSLGKTNRRMTSIDAEVTLQSAMQVSAIFNSLNDFLTANSDPSLVKTALKEHRRVSALVLMDHDLFLLADQKSGDSTTDSYLHTIMQAFCSSFNSLFSYSAKVLVGSPNKEKTFHTGDVSSSYGILYSASCATVYNMCKLFGTMVNCLSVTEFSARMNHGNSGFSAQLFFTSLCEALFKFPTTSDNSLENMKVIFLALIAMFSQDNKNKRTLVKEDYFIWICGALDDCTAQSVTSLLSNNIPTLCIVLVGSVLEDTEWQKDLASSESMEKSCITILRIVVNGLAKDTDVEESLHVTCLRLICQLISEDRIRSAVLLEKDDMINPLRARIQANLSLNPAAEAFTLSNKILKYIDPEAEGVGAGDDSVKGKGAEVDTITLVEEYLNGLLTHLPDEANTVDYKQQHPKDSGAKLLINYTKSYIAEHGSLYDETASPGEF